MSTSNVLKTSDLVLTDLILLQDAVNVYRIPLILEFEVPRHTLPSAAERRDIPDCMSIRLLMKKRSSTMGAPWLRCCKARRGKLPRRKLILLVITLCPATQQGHGLLLGSTKYAPLQVIMKYRGQNASSIL
jgi:hypothetical protein